MITLLTKLEANDRKSEDGIKALLIELSSSVGGETGSLSYQVFSTANDDCTLWVLESWATQADADRHGALVVTNGAVERATALLAAPIATTRLTPVQ